MKLSDLYKERITQAEALRRDVWSHHDVTVRDSIRSRALSLEIEAQNLAHCCLRFGDQEVLAVDIDSCRAAVEKAQCDGCNPWYRGLTLIERIRSEAGRSTPA